MNARKNSLGFFFINTYVQLLFIKGIFLILQNQLSHE